jgi:hypothetical protein
MNMSSRKEYLVKMRARYGRAQGRKYKTRLIEEVVALCGYDRKHVIKLLRTRAAPRLLKRSGPVPRYGAEVVTVLERLWLASDELCGKRLKAALSQWLPHYEHEYGALAEPVRAALVAVSAASIDRLLQPARARRSGKSRSGTKPGRWLKNQIPIKTDQWDEKRPGFMEADTVAHCGDSLEGDFIWSLVFTDIATGWTEMRAVWNKGSSGVIEQTRKIEKSLPFALLGFDCDNGSEFLNHHLWRYFTERPQPVQFTRSRPYHKNDNAHVEQKNWTHVRCLLGYGRLERSSLVERINRLYRGPWQRFHNHFCPSVKLLEKRREGARIIKRHDEPKTPYQRLLESRTLDAAAQARLVREHEKLNPFELKRQIDAALRQILRAPSRRARVCDSAPGASPLRSEAPSAPSHTRKAAPHLTRKVA